MNKTLKKILVAGASLLMFASVGSMANNPVNARHHYHHLTANMWYKRNARRLNRRGRRSVLYRRGWHDARYVSNSFEARLSPTYAHNVNYRHGWIIGYTYSLNGDAYIGSARITPYWNAINLFNKGCRYARLRHIHHRVYLGDYQGHWERTEDAAFNEVED